MSPIERQIIERKLDVIIACLRLLSPIVAEGVVAYQADIYRRKATERLLQEMVEALVDINTHLLSKLKERVPDDMYSSFIRLGATGVITPDLAANLAPSAGLRNRLVHEYDALDDTIILESAARAVLLVPDYVTAIVAYLNIV